MSDNYERAKLDAQKQFLGADIESICAKWNLKADGEALYVRFLNRDYQVSRSTGAVTLKGKTVGFSETMVLFDLLTYAETAVRVTGELVSHERLAAVQTSSSGHGSMFTPHAKRFDADETLFRRGCEALGGTFTQKGDCAFILPVFRDLTVTAVLWHSDDEFPAQLQWFTDKATLRFMHYETMMFLLLWLSEEIAKVGNSGK